MSGENWQQCKGGGGVGGEGSADSLHSLHCHRLLLSALPSKPTPAAMFQHQPHRETPDSKNWCFVCISWRAVLTLNLWKTGVMRLNKNQPARLLPSLYDVCPTHWADADAAATPGIHPQKLWPHHSTGAVQCASLKYCQTEVESSAGGGLGGWVMRAGWESATLIIPHG